MMDTHRSTDQSNPEKLEAPEVKDSEINKMAEYTAFVLSMASVKTSEKHLQQGIIGAATETGEMLDALKKHMFQGRPIDPVNIKEECGDLWFYLTEIMSAIDTNIFEVMEMNVAKLEQRYPDGFETQKSIDRDLDEERKILEDRENPPIPTQKACCGNCAERLKLKGCSRYVKTNDDGCCIDHKFLK